jgi:hypothetical protein
VTDEARKLLREWLSADWESTTDTVELAQRTEAFLGIGCDRHLPDGFGRCGRDEADPIHGYGAGGYQHAYQRSVVAPITASHEDAK